MLKKLFVIFAMLYAAVAFAAVDVNKATAAELDAIKGIGPGISGKILDERKKGPFKDWDDMIKRVNGVGETNAAKFSAEGMTVGGSSFKGVAATPTAKKDDKPAAKDAKDSKPAATPAAAPAKDAKAADAKPAATAPAVDAKAEAKAKKEADKKAKDEAKAKAAEEKKAKADADKKAKADAKPAAKDAKAADAKPAAAKDAASAVKK